MATYPIKMLRDEDRQPFLPFTNAAAVVDKDNKTLQELMDNGKYKIINNVTTTSAGKGVLDAYQGKVLKDNFNNYVPLSQKGVANGVATLDGEGKVPSTQLPSYVDDVLETYIRTGTTALAADWLSLTDGGAALTPEKGKIYLIMTAGSYQNKQYRWGGSTYVLCNPSDVNSVNGMTGVVVLKDLTIQKNGTKVGDTYNGGVAKTINITVPTKTSDITNDSGFVTTDTDITGNAATATNATNDKNGLQIDTNYLKLSGGTMTGKLSMSTAAGAIQFAATTATNVNTNTTFALSYQRLQSYANIYLNANTDDSASNEGILLTAGHGMSTSSADGLWVLPDAITWKNSPLVTQSNFTSQALATTTTNGLLSASEKKAISGLGEIITIKKTLAVGTDWIDTGIKNTDLENGVYLVTLTGFTTADSVWSITYAGLMYWYGQETNSHDTCELPLHWSGHASNGFCAYLRTKADGRGDSSHISLSLQIAASKQTTECELTFKFKKIM